MSGALDLLVLGTPPLAAAASALGAGTTGGEVTLPRPAWPFTLAALHRTSGRALLVVAPGDEEARELASELNALVGHAAVSLWPTRGVPTGGAVGPAPHLVGLRARARGRVGEAGSLVIASVAALVERAPANPPQPLELRRGATLADDLVEALAALGYERVAQVEERGEMAVRGGIVDVFPTTAEQPVRVDLFGDDIDELRSFSPFTQVTVRQIDSIRIWPAAEPLGGQLIDTFDELGRAALVRLAPTQHQGALAQALELVEDEAAAGALGDPAALLGALAEHSALDLAPPAGGAAGVVDAREARFAARGHVEAAAEIARLAGGGLRVLVAFSRRGDLERAARPLERANPRIIDIAETPPAAGEVSLTVLPIRRGFISADLGLAVIPEGEILRRRRASARAPVGRRLRSFLELRVGDYVVHEDHGVGRLVAFETQTVANVTRDYLALAFAGEDRVWVPQDQLDKVTRYIGADGCGASPVEARRQGVGAPQGEGARRGARDGRRVVRALRGPGPGGGLRLPRERRGAPRVRAAVPVPGDA